jgi:hypothetical protein
MIFNPAKLEIEALLLSCNLSLNSLVKFSLLQLSVPFTAWLGQELVYQFTMPLPIAGAAKAATRQERLPGTETFSALSLR